MTGPNNKRETSSERMTWVDEQWDKHGNGDVPIGGAETQGLFHETLAAYKHGLFRATIALSASVVEDVLVEQLITHTDLYGIDEKRTNYPSLKPAAEKAMESSLITNKELEQIKNICDKARNPNLHFRSRVDSTAPSVKWRQRDPNNRFAFIPGDDPIGKQWAQTTVVLMFQLITQTWERKRANRC